EVDAICQVVRAFDDENITHVSGKVDPIDDIEVINMELIFADLESIERRLPRVEKMARQKDKDDMFETDTLTKIKNTLEQNKPVHAVSLTDDEKTYVKHLESLTQKPIKYVANAAEDESTELENNDYLNHVTEYAEAEGEQVVPDSAKVL